MALFNWGFSPCILKTMFVLLIAQQEMWSCVKYHFSWNDSWGWLSCLKSTGHFTQLSFQAYSFPPKAIKDIQCRDEIFWVQVDDLMQDQRVVRSHGGRTAAGRLGCWLFGFPFHAATIVLGLQWWDSWNSRLDNRFNYSSGGAQKKVSAVGQSWWGLVLYTFYALSPFLQFSFFPPEFSTYRRAHFHDQRPFRAFCYECIN